MSTLIVLLADCLKSDLKVVRVNAKPLQGFDAAKTTYAYLQFLIYTYKESRVNAQPYTEI